MSLCMFILRYKKHAKLLKCAWGVEKEQNMQESSGDQVGQFVCAVLYCIGCDLDHNLLAA